MGEVYYLCFQAVWFVAKSPEGPWELADKVPSEVYQIPPSAPVYPTTYVYVYDTNPQYVTYGYLPGYYGDYYAWGVMAFGTGWYYGSYVYDDVYWPYAYTYGAGAWYNEHTGTYGRSAVAYGPYGGAGRAAAYNPTTGTYARGAAAYGEYRAGAWAEAYNPRTGTTARTAQGSNVYGNWRTHGGGARRRLGQRGAGQRRARGTPRLSARRAAAAPSWRAGTTTSTSARTVRSTGGPRAAAGSSTTAASGAAPPPRAPIRAPCRASTATPRLRATGASRASQSQAWRSSGGGGGYGGGDLAAVGEAACAAAADEAGVAARHARRHRPVADPRRVPAGRGGRGRARPDRDTVLSRARSRTGRLG